MKKLFLLFSFMFAAIVSANTYAWQQSTNVKIVALIAWEDLDDGGPLHFKLSNDVWCYVPSGKKTLQSLILAMYVSGKEISEIHCYDIADNNNAAVSPAHKLHRIIAK